MGSGSACTERTVTSRSCPSRVCSTGCRAARGRSARRRWRPGRKRGRPLFYPLLSLLYFLLHPLFYLLPLLLHLLFHLLAPLLHFLLRPLLKILLKPTARCRASYRDESGSEEDGELASHAAPYWNDSCLPNSSLDASP